MFIDKVDFDFCLSLAEEGFKIVRINSLGLLHEVGHSTQASFFGKNYMIYHHNSFRRYYMSRNAVYVARKHSSLNIAKELLKEIRRIILVFVYEDQKLKKLWSSITGLRDGFKMPIN